MKLLLLNKKIFFILILYILFFLIIDEGYIYKNNYNDGNLSIVINIKNLSENIHLFYYDIIKELNTTRSFYFIKTSRKSLLDNLNELIKDKSIKIVQSNFPDSIFLPLVVSLFGNNLPELVLFIEGEEFLNYNKSELINWINRAISEIKYKNYDYIFGNSQIINETKIGCSLLLSRSSIIQHLLYHTNSDTTHINPFIQLSLATKTCFKFMLLNDSLEASILENIKGSFSQNIICPSINDKLNPTLGIMIPAFKRDYFSLSFPQFSKQTFKPKFYVIIQNDNRQHLNLSLIQSFVNEPVYHIWMQNWNSFFILNFRLSSVLPCDFILKYDDDQWPNDNYLHEYLINNIKNKNIILGFRNYVIEKSMCGYLPKYYKNIEKDIGDHVAVPLLIRQGYLKLEARNRIFRLYGIEDVSLSVNSNLYCNVISKKIKMNLIEKQNDGNSQSLDGKIISEIIKEKMTDKNFILNGYCFYIHSGFIPKKWGDFRISRKDYINITNHHKVLY